jgi:hypothetical protein
MRLPKLDSVDVMVSYPLSRLNLYHSMTTKNRSSWYNYNMCDVKRMHPVHSADNMKKLGQMLKILSFQRYKKGYNQFDVKL